MHYLPYGNILYLYLLQLNYQQQYIQHMWWENKYIYINIYRLKHLLRASQSITKVLLSFLLTCFFKCTYYIVEIVLSLLRDRCTRCSLFPITPPVNVPRPGVFSFLCCVSAKRYMKVNRTESKTRRRRRSQ